MGNANTTVWVRIEGDGGRTASIACSSATEVYSLKELVKEKFSNRLHRVDAAELVIENGSGKEFKNSRAISSIEGVGRTEGNPFVIKIPPSSEEIESDQPKKKRMIEPAMPAEVETPLWVDSFTRSVASCASGVSLAGDHHYVDLDRVVEECCDIVRQYVDVEGPGTVRAPPLALVRMARGGKTTTLARLFDRLKKEGDLHPILISFSSNAGESHFELRKGESPSEAILRVIAAQLSDQIPAICAQRVLVDREALDLHLGKDKVVLLIDELNALGNPLDRGAASLLREMFLDKLGRYLVFTSHPPVWVDGSCCRTGGGIEAVADPIERGLRTVNMSRAESVGDLKSMTLSCQAVTEARAAWLGYIPSLVCSIFGSPNEASYVAKQSVLASAKPPPGKEMEILQRFVVELLTGVRDVHVSPYYGAFASVGRDGKTSYPLCYIKEILALFEDSSEIHSLLKVLLAMEASLAKEDNGRGWEYTVKAAVILRMLRIHWAGFGGPFNLVPEGIKPELVYRTLPNERLSLGDAKEHMDSILAKCSKPTLMLMSCSNAESSLFNGFVAYTEGAAQPAKIIGYQARAGNEKPTAAIDTSVINGGGVLIRGRASAYAKSKPLPGWKYMRWKEVQKFLGSSLQLAMASSKVEDS